MSLIAVALFYYIMSKNKSDIIQIMCLTNVHFLNVITVLKLFVILKPKTGIPTIGKIDVKAINDSEGLTGLLKKPPTMQRDLQPLTYEQISGFKLQPGKLGDIKSTLSSSHRKKKKRKDQEDGEGLGIFI